MDFDKRAIRKSIISMRDGMSTLDKERSDNIIYENLIGSSYYRNAQVIFAFVSFGSEVDTKKFIEYALRDNKVICVPKIISKEQGMELFSIDSLEDLKPGFYGILEPKDECRILDKHDVDFILMPGVAFDREGGRIGYGGGFYDRFLSQLNRRAPRIAIAYDMQIIDKVPMSETDMRIDGVITEKETMIFEL